jgi:hypothetical protein
MRRAILPILIPLLLAAPARAQEPAGEEPEGYVAAEPGPAWVFGGYVDVGFANAQGNGTSFNPRDMALPADYGVDAFAPAVNSRGDVASIDSGGLFTNGFLPRSLGIGGRPSFFVSTVSFDVRYEPHVVPAMVFARAQLLPRLTERGSETRLFLEQAFGRVSPLADHELALFAGRFDSVFGIEYLENQANLRTGITPSLVARYTTGTPIGLKAFYRTQLPAAWSALSLNVAATNSGTFVEVLQPAEISLTGEPVASGRLGYELNLPRVELKLGASGLYGGRNDQGDRQARQRAFGGDARLFVAGVSLAAEYVHVDEDAGRAADKLTGAGPQTLPSEFHARGFYVFASYELPFSAGPLRRTIVYARAEQRHAWFEGHTPITVQRLTTGLRLDLWDLLAVKAEYLANREAEGAPPVPNNVLAGSAVFSF